MILRTLQALGILALAGQSIQASTAPGRACPPGGDAVPCELRVYYNNLDGKVVPIRGDELPISRGRDVEVWVESWTQYGKQWPQEQAKYQLGTQRGCPDRYQISNLTPHRFRLHVIADDADQCQLEVRLVEPREVVRELDAVWETTPGTPATPAGTVYSRAQAQSIARDLYRALLAREADASGLSAATADIQSGRLEVVLDRMLASPEYADLRRNSNANQVLQNLYSGFFNRAIDPQGLRSYQPRVSRGDVRSVALELLASQEYLDRLAARR